MALDTNKNLKLYYSISEVAEQFGVSESLLRFWEKQFPQINPRKSGRNVRQYTAEDIEQIRLIYNLVKVRGFKLAAARKMLNANRLGADRSADVLHTLMGVRDDLKALKKQLDTLS